MSVKAVIARERPFGGILVDIQTPDPNIRTHAATQNPLSMEIFLGLIDLVVGILDFAALVADVVSFFKGRDNRIERRIARRAGSEMPPRDKWNRRVIGLTLIVVVVTTVLLTRILG